MATWLESINGPELRADDVTHLLGQTVALKDVSVEIAPNRLNYIEGPSGSGKTTLLHLLAGFTLSNDGTVSFNGRSYADLSKGELNDLRANHFGAIFQRPILIGNISAGKNITSPREGAGRTVDRPWVDKVTKQLGITGLLERMPSELSGGEQQRVTVARALVGQPDVVFADEPTASLDTANKERLRGFFDWMTREQGVTVVMVSHDPIPKDMVGQTILLRDGVVQPQAQPSSPLVESVPA